MAVINARRRFGRSWGCIVFFRCNGQTRTAITNNIAVVTSVMLALHQFIAFIGQAHQISHFRGWIIHFTAVSVMVTIDRSAALYKRQQWQQIGYAFTRCTNASQSFATSQSFSAKCRNFRRSTGGNCTRKGSSFSHRCCCRSGFSHASRGFRHKRPNFGCTCDWCATCARHCRRSNFINTKQVFRAFKARFAKLLCAVHLGNRSQCTSKTALRLWCGWHFALTLGILLIL